MPIYEYQCTGCNKIYEIMQSFDDEPLEICEECGGLLKKIVSESTFKLEGEGWSKDGYTNPSKKSS